MAIRVRVPKSARIETGPVDGWYVRVSVAAVLIAFALVGSRAYILYPPSDDSTFNLFKTATKAVVGSAYDAALVGGLTAAFFVFLLAIQKRQWASRATYCLFLLSATLLLVQAS